MNEGLIDVSVLGTVVQSPLSSSFWPKQMQALSSLGHPNDPLSDTKGKRNRSGGLFRTY